MSAPEDVELAEMLVGAIETLGLDMDTEMDRLGGIESAFGRRMAIFEIILASLDARGARLPGGDGAA
jgi:hypothetical protein